MVSTERRFNGSMAVSTDEVDSVDSIEVQFSDGKFNCHSFRPSSLPNAGEKNRVRQALKMCFVVFLLFDPSCVDQWLPSHVSVQGLLRPYCDMLPRA